ncbi:MAG: hypothetical protein HOY79_17485 [Streptomyces sp.]|nr:hypothetical protein [Streptomyces sp.]
MSFTEHLKPGDHPEQKRTVGENIPEIYATTAELPPEIREPAMRAVAGRAVNAADARLLLDALGLLKGVPTNEDGAGE